MLTSFWLTFILMNSELLRHHSGWCWEEQHPWDITREPKNSIKKSNKISCYFKCWTVTHSVNSYGQDLEASFSSHLTSTEYKYSLLYTNSTLSQSTSFTAKLYPCKYLHLPVKSPVNHVYTYGLRIITDWYPVHRS